MALSSTAGAGLPTGYEQDAQMDRPRGTAQGGSYSSTGAVSQLFARLSQEIEEKQPKNCIHFVVDFLCKHYPEHLHGFASIWQMDPDLERERHEVVNFFKAHKISTAVAAHFTNAGYDTLDTLTTLSPDSLVDVEAFNNVKWLPGHKVRLQQIFGEISARVRAYRQQCDQAQNAPPSPRARHHGRHHHHHGGHHPSHHHSQNPHHSAQATPQTLHHQAAALASAGGHQVLPYSAGNHGTLHGASSAVYGGLAGHLATSAVPSLAVGRPLTAAGVPSAINTGCGLGLSQPVLPAAAGNLFQYGAYPSA